MYSKAIWWSDDRLEVFHDQLKLKLAFSFDQAKGLRLTSSVYENDFDSIDGWAGCHRFVDMKYLKKWHVLNRILRVNSFYRTTVEKKVVAASNGTKGKPVEFKPE